MPDLKPVLRPAIRAARMAPVYARLALCRGPGPLAAFLPAYGRHGAALLRIYNIAEALGAHGWRTLVLPWNLTLAQRLRVLSAAHPDVVVMQGARHALNRPGLYAGYRVVYDMDDADFHLPHLAGHVERAMQDVAGVIAGSRYVAEWCRGRGAAAEVVWTGTPVSRRPRTSHAGRPAVVAWAQTAPETYRAEADWVLDVMRRLAVRRPDVTLRLYGRGAGDDGGFLSRFHDAGIRTEWLYSAGYSDYLASFDDVALGLAPLCPETPFSRGKSFGKVLAYLDRHVPVIASDACEHGRFFAADTGVVSSDPDVWLAAADRLLGDAEARRTMSETAFARFARKLSVDESARRVDRLLRRYAT